MRYFCVIKVGKREKKRRIFGIYENITDAVNMKKGTIQRLKGDEKKGIIIHVINI